MTCCWLSVRAAWRLLHAVCMHLTLDTLKTVLLDAVSLNGGTSGGCQLSPRCPLVSNLGGMGSWPLWGPFALFAVVRGDDGDLPARRFCVSRAQFCSAHYYEKCEEQLCSRLAQRTSNCGQRTT
jgi:hypothetical protein